MNEKHAKHECLALSQERKREQMRELHNSLIQRLETDKRKETTPIQKQIDEILKKQQNKDAKLARSTLYRN